MTPRRTSAQPIEAANGVLFYCYRVGIGRHEWRTRDGRLRVGSYTQGTTYYAMVDDMPIKGPDPAKPRRFLLRVSAMTAAVRALP
jgi:hypothetical protein